MAINNIFILDSMSKNKNYTMEQKVKYLKKKLLVGEGVGCGGGVGSVGSGGGVGCGGGVGGGGENIPVSHRDDPSEKRLVSEEIPGSIHINVFTSMFMVSNVAHLYFKRDFVYFISFLLLLCSSLVHHGTGNEYLGIIDKLFVYNVVFQGGMRLFKNYKNNLLLSFITVITFIGVCALYIIGYFRRDFCFHKDKILGNKYHGLVHLMGSLGHHAIAKLL